MIIKHFPANQVGRDFVVGDVHGCYWPLMEALYDLDFCFEKDRLFSVGDLIDRGPDSLYALRLYNERWFHGVRGNHEQLMFDALVREDRRMYEVWLHNGGGWFLESDDKVIEAMAKDLDSKLPYAIEVETKSGRKIGIVHAEAGVRDWRKIKTTTRLEQMIWGRGKIKRNDTSNIDGIDHIYVGHSVVKEPTDLGNVSYIDYGVCFTDKPFELFQIDNL